MLLCKRVKRDRVYFGKICCSADLRVTSAHTRHSHFPEGFVPTFFPKKILKKDMLKWCFLCCLDDKVSKHYSQKLPEIDATFPGSFVIYCINNSEVTPFPFLDWERKESDMDFTLKHFFSLFMDEYGCKVQIKDYLCLKMSLLSGWGREGQPAGIWARSSSMCFRNRLLSKCNGFITLRVEEQ